MNTLTALLLLGMGSSLPAPARFTRIALACESGCVSADSLQVSDALRAGLSHHGVTVVTRRVARESLPLLVTGRITVEDGVVRVSAEFVELDREISRYSVRASHQELSAEVQRMGDRFGRALIQP
jgi:hypothetical protein